MTAISPSSIRLTRSLVCLPSRTGPTTHAIGVGVDAPPRRAESSSPRSLPPVSSCADYAAVSSSLACLPAASSPLSAPSMRTISASWLLAADRVDPGDRRLAVGLLDDPEVGRGERGDLGEVGDADDLTPLSERPQPLADAARDLAADAGVDLVEDERLDLAGRAGARQRQHHPRELAAGGGLAERRDRHPRIRRDPQLDGLARREAP